MDNVENLLFIRIRDGTNMGAQDVWTLTETARFNARETKEFLAESTGYDVVAGLLPPVRNVDYRANASRRGTGADLSGQLTVTHPNTASYNGKGTLIRVTFGASRGWLTLLKLRTLNAFRLDDPVLLLAEDADSRDAYGRRIRSIDARWTRQVDAAQATIDHRLARRRHPRTVLNLVVPAGSRANAMLLLHRSISDRVAVRYPEMGIDGHFFIEGHRIIVEGGLGQGDPRAPPAERIAHARLPVLLPLPPSAGRGELEKWSSYIIPPSAGKGARGVKFLPLPPAPRGKIEMGVPLQHHNQGVDHGHRPSALHQRRSPRSHPPLVHAAPRAHPEPLRENGAAHVARRHPDAGAPRPGDGLGPQQSHLPHRHRGVVGHLGLCPRPATEPALQLPSPGSAGEGQDGGPSSDGGSGVRADSHSSSIVWSRWPLPLLTASSPRSPSARTKGRTARL